MKWVTALVDLSLLFLLSQIVNTKEHLRAIQGRFLPLTCLNILYNICAGLVVNAALITFYWLTKYITYLVVNFFGKKWQEFQDRKAAANLPPKPQKPIWQPKQRKKKKNNMTW